MQAIRTTLARGSEGAEVAYLQTLLKILGYATNSVDGSFGVNTEHQVKAFQADNGIAIDGIVGDNTWRALEAAIAKLSKPAGGIKIPYFNIVLPLWAVALVGVGGLVLIIEFVRFIKAKKQK